MSVPSNWEIGSLLVNCFARLDPTVKKRLNELFVHQVIDQIIWDMVQEGIFPKWFQDAFSFDPPSGQLNGLREALADATKDWLIVADGNKYCLINFSEDELAGMARHIDLTNEEVQRISLNLNSRLSKAD